MLNHTDMIVLDEVQLPEWMPLPPTEESEIEGFDFDDSFLEKASQIDTSQWDEMMKTYNNEVCVCGDTRLVHKMNTGECGNSKCGCTSFSKKSE